MTPVATILSFRLGGTDGVAIEARKWHTALQHLGFHVRRVAGEIADIAQPDDIVVPGLWSAAHDVDSEAVLAAIAGSDIVIADNICSLPVNVAASRATARAIEQFGVGGGRVLFRHHDVPWQRNQFRDFEPEFPTRTPGALHTTINLRTRREMQARRYEDVTTIHNYFDLDAPHGQREATRAELGFAEDDIVLFHPARAIERKNIPGAVRFIQQFQRRVATLMPDRAVRYWLTGPAEDGYGPMLDRVLERCPAPVTLGRASTPANGYAASDVVLFPSTWEGFGNPTIESIWARRPCVVFPYPVLTEIVACGVRLFDMDQVDDVVRFVRAPDENFLDVNLRRARISFSIDELPAAIDAALRTHGWSW